MDTVLCLDSALEIYHGLRTAGVTRPLLDPALRSRPLPLRRTSAASGQLKTPAPEEAAALLARASALEAPNALPASRTPLDAGIVHLTPPLHVLTASANARRTTSTRVPHLTSANLPPRSLVSLGEGLQASSPEHLFLQAAARLQKTELIWLGSLLCAMYSQHPRKGGHLLPAFPLTQKARLVEYAAQAQGASLRGASKAASAAAHVVEGAASPRELAFALLACLPLAMGGRGIPHPQLNRRVEVDQRVGSIHGARAFSCDMLWAKERLVVEYNSDLHHLDPRQHAKDNAKIAGLEELGYRVIPLSTEQFDRLLPTDDALLKIARHLGMRNRAADSRYDWQARRWGLRKRLLTLCQAGYSLHALGQSA